jgi:hypothetical protein
VPPDRMTPPRLLGFVQHRPPQLDRPRGRSARIVPPALERSLGGDRRSGGEGEASTIGNREVIPVLTPRSPKRFARQILPTVRRPVATTGASICLGSGTLEM